MKAKLDFRSKRTIIIAAIIGVLAVTAGIGGYFYAKGNNQTGATNENGNTSTTANNGIETTTPDNGIEPNVEGNQDGTENANADNNGTTNANTDNAGNAENGGATDTRTPGGRATGDNRGNAGVGGTGEIDGNRTTDARNIDNGDTDATTTTEIVEENIVVEEPWESHLVRWTPEDLNILATNVDVNDNKILVSKTATTSTGYNAVSSGDEIQYTIYVTNANEEELNSVYISDVIPEGAEFVSVQNDGATIEEDGVVKSVYWNLWNLGLSKGDTYSVSFTVKVIDKEGTIKNIANVEGKTSNDGEPTRNPIFNTKKTASLVEDDEITELEENDIIKPGQIIRYGIEVTNTSNEVNATVKVSDTVPEGTTLYSENVTVVNGEETETYSIEELNAGIELTLEEESNAIISFDVIVNNDASKKIINMAKVGNETPTTNTDVTNITGTKKVDKEVAKVGETLTYTITLTNSGNADGKATVTDEIPEGTTIKDEETEGYDAETNTITWEDVEVKAGESVDLTFEVVINKDRTTAVINTAILDDEEIPDKPETKVANITATKTSEGSSEVLHENDVITYTIKVTNNGDGNGTVTIKDEVPVGTTIYGKEGNEVLVSNEDTTYSINQLIQGLDIEVKAGETRDVVFSVTINPFKEGDENVTTILNEDGTKTSTIIITNYVASIDNEPIPGTEDEAEKEYVTVSITKNWIHPRGTEMQDISNKFNLLQNGIEIEATPIRDNTTYTSINLDKHAPNGEEYSYTITEEAIEGYTSSEVIGNQEDGFEVTNTVEQEKISVTITKEWKDPFEEHINISDKLHLYKDEELVENVTPTKEGDVYTFEGLDKYDLTDGHVYRYTITEDSIEGYTSSDVTGNQEDGFEVTNTIEQDEISVTITKEWRDPYKDHIDLSDKLYIYKDAELVEDATLIKEGDIYTFTGLDKYDLTDGHVYRYTIVEDPIDGYTTLNITGNQDDGYLVINTIKQEEISVRITKEWIDSKEEHIDLSDKFNLYRDRELIENITPTKEGDVYTFEGLDKYDLTDGHVYRYTITEDSIDGYTSSEVTGNQDDGFAVTNIVKQEEISVTITKEWRDPYEDHIDLSDKLHLYKDEELVENVTPTKEGDVYTFEGLDKYDLTNGHVYSYTITEDSIDGYTSSDVTGNQDDGFEVINTIEQDETSVTITKEWRDPYENHIDLSDKLHLYKDGELVADATPTKQGEIYTFAELEKYDLTDGHEYSYTITEDNINGYTSSDVTGSQENGYEVINTIEQEKISVTITKEWVDLDGANHIDLTNKLHLYRDQKIVENVTPIKEGDVYTFTELDKYDLTDGHVYSYTIIEDRIEGYESSDVTGNQDDGFEVTNSIEKENTSLTITKIWDDSNDIAGFRDSITITIKESGEIYGQPITIDADTEGVTIEEIDGKTRWTYTVEDLPLYKLDEDGEYELNNGNVQLCVYTAEETKIGSETVTNNKTSKYQVSTQQQRNFVTITNKHTPTTVNISGTKEWDDNGNSDGLRPDTITINLLANGEIARDSNGRAIITTASASDVDANGKWKYSFTNLPEYKNGEKIVYTVEEEEVEGYKPTVDGYDIKNVHIPSTIDITLTKKWEDGNTSSLRPNSVTFVLYANNTPIQLKTINKSNSSTWTATIRDLPEYKNGQKIVYTIKEIKDATGVTLDNLEERAEFVEEGKSFDENYYASYNQEDYTVTNGLVKATKSSVTSTPGTNKVKAGDTITYTIEIKNYGPTSVENYKVTDSDLLTLLREEKIVMMNGNTEVSANNACISVSGGRDNISANTLGNGYTIAEINSKETITITFVAKVKNALPGDHIINKLGTDNKVENEVMANINLLKKVENPQEVVIVIDLSLSMAQAVIVPEAQRELKDPMAYTYEATRWYALKGALDDFIDTFMATSGNEITILGYNENTKEDGKYILLKTTNSATEAKNSYANVFTKTHFNTIKNAVNGFNNEQIAEWNNQHDTDISTTSNVREIDVDGLKDTSIFTSSNMTLLGSGTNIEAGLLAANYQLSKMAAKADKNIILMTDGAANRRVTNPDTTGDTYTIERNPSVADREAGIKNAANKIKNTTHAKLFTVGFCDDSDAILRTIASENGENEKYYYKSTNMAKLKADFKTISETMTPYEKNGIKTDDGKIVLSGEDMMKIETEEVSQVKILVNGITVLNVSKWADFSEYFTVTSTTETIDIRAIVDDYNSKHPDDKIESITEDISITITQL